MARKMKDSGIPWVGKIPEDWEVTRGKYCLQLLNRQIKGDDGVITCFRDGEVTLRSKRREEGFTVSLKECGYQGVEPGDLVVHGMDGFAGSIGISDSRGKASPVLNVIDSNECKKYIMYYLRSMAYRDVFLALSTGIRVRSCDLRWNKLANLQYILPPLSEQKRIAEYLDKTVGRIDGLREKISREIERLGDYKKSMISEAVCRGLDKTAKMKDSGIPWVGKIPAGWEVSPLYKYVKQVKNPNLGMREKNLLSLSYGKIKRKDISTVTGLIPASYEGYNIISTGDIVLRLTDLQNDKRSIRVGLAKIDGIVTSAYVTIRPFETCCPDYLAYLILVFDIKKGFYGIGSGVRQGLTYDEIKKLKFIFPPLAEQKRIAEYIDKQVAKIDALIEKRKAELERLEALKRSIICECVTGKMEVAS